MKNIFLLVLLVCSLRISAQVNYINYLPSQYGHVATLGDDLALDTTGNPTFVGECVGCFPFSAYLYHFNGSSWTILDTNFNYVSYDTPIAYDHFNNLWVYRGDSLIEWNNGVINSYPAAPVDSFQMILKMQFDGNNNLWALACYGGYLSNTVFKFDGASWTMFDSTQIGLNPDEVIRGFTIDNNNDIFVSGNYSGLHKYNGTSWTTINSGNSNLPSNVLLFDITSDSQNNIWVLACDSFGQAYLYEYSGNTFANANISPNSLGLMSAERLVTDSLDNIWFLSGDQMAKYNGSFLTFFPPDNNIFLISQPQGYKVNKRNNDIWIASDLGGGTSVILFNENGFQTIRGKVFNDANQNGILDNNESGLVNEMVYGSASNFALTDSSGNYNLAYTDSNMAITLSHTTKPYRIQTNVPLAYTVTPAVDSTQYYNFGIYPYPNINDGYIDGYIEYIRPGFSCMGYVFYGNTGTTVLSDTITLVYDTLLQFTGASVTPVFQSGNTLKFAYANLAPFDYGNIQLNFNVPATAVIGDTVHLSGIINPVATDTIPYNNTFNIPTIVGGSFDPNHKTVTPQGIGVTGQIAANDKLTYTINFQNTGTDTAFTVMVTDTLSSNLDVSTFQLLSFSHHVIVQMEGSGILKFMFYNINLPDSSVNEPASIGYVRFTISVKPTLVINDQILNTANIFFDYNTPIVTNTTLNTIAFPNSIVTADVLKNDFIIYPNPTNGNITVITNAIAGMDNEVKILEMTGRNIFEKKNIHRTENINCNALSNGMYMIQVMTGNSVMTKKISVQKE